MTHASTTAVTTVPTNSRGPRRRRHEKFLDTATLLEEAGPPRVARQAVALVAVLTLGAVTWAAATELDEAAAVQGEVIPAGSIRVVQHLEGGIVKEILVKEDQIVEAGQTLLRLDEAAAQAELGRTRTREVALSLQAERLRAFVEDRQPDLAAHESRYRDLVADQLAILKQQTESRSSQLAVLKAQIRERQAELESERKRRQTLRRHLALVEEELAMRKKLLDKGLMSRIVYLEVQREANRTKGELIGLQSSLARARDAIQGAKGRILELKTRLRSEAMTELGEVSAELAQVRQTLPKLEDHVQRLEVTSPVRGVIKHLSLNTIGGVVPPGQPFMEIVPIDDELVVEVQIRPQDIGHVVLGQEAMVRVSSFDYARFGGIAAELKSVSASTFEDDDGRPFYKGILELSKSHLGEDATVMRVLPGMTVQANIGTGRRTVLEYLFAPVHRVVATAFHER